MKTLRNIILVLVLCSQTAAAQHWKKVFTVPSIGSAAFFINPNVGWVGTGNYPAGSLGQIFYTRNGGATWGISFMPNMKLIGQVTDIFFSDSLNGWATVREAFEHGWSGLYRSFDGGESWMLWYQTEFPIAIRQNSKGVFFSERLKGIKRSVDGGLSFQTILVNGGALGLDLDEQFGILSSEATGVYNVTTDGGLSWHPFTLNQEAWGTFADPSTGNLFISSERDNSFPGRQALIASITPTGTNPSILFTGKGDELTGGIAGNKGCRSVIYVQRQPGGGPDGLLRSTNGGLTWIGVGGPYNYNDKRFAVTGNGAVVYAFATDGSVWKTSDGGDGLLSPSVIDKGSLSIVPQGVTMTTSICDSMVLALQFSFSGCDSLFTTRVTFPDDSKNELRSKLTGSSFGKTGSKKDSIVITYKPVSSGTTSQRVRISFRQANGFVEDTIITITVVGKQPPDKPVYVEAINNSLDFGISSICGGDSVRIITITNTGCADLNVSSVMVTGSAFMVLSSTPSVILGPGISRQYLLRFKPTVQGKTSGLLIVQTGQRLDTIILTGEGISGSKGYKITSSILTSTICDSAEGTIVIRNISCSTVRLDSLDPILSPFRYDPISLPVTLTTDTTLIIHYHFVPTTPGVYSQKIFVHSTNINETFDTSFTITAIATEGKADHKYFPPSITFDSTSICSWQELEFTIISTGCDTLEIPIDSLQDTSAFHIVSDLSDRSLRSGDTATLRIRFHPSGIGTFGSTLHLNTNTGPIDIPILGFGSSDPGIFSISNPILGSVFTCKDTTVRFLLSNMTCDSIIVDSIVVGGPEANDYRLSPYSFSAVHVGDIDTIFVKFSPQAGGLRPATITFYLRQVDGTLIPQTSFLGGTGIQPIPVRLTLPNIAFSAKAGESIQIPIFLLDTSSVPVSRIEYIIHLDLDLLEVSDFDLTGTVLKGAILRPLQLHNDSIVITIDLSPPVKLDTGLIGTLICKAFVTDTTTTSIEPLIFSIFDSANTTDCLPASIVKGPQTVTSFILEPECGTTVLGNYLKYGIEGIVIESIIPNPTRSEITVTATAATMTDDLTIDILDASGAVIQRQIIPRSQLKSALTYTVRVQGPSGIRTLRLRNGTAERTEKFILVR